MEQKRYVDIERLKDKYALAFKGGEHIVCQEKLDGANASIRYNPETDALEAFSRRNKLNEQNTLQGFYVYVLTLDPVKWADATSNGRYIIFGEWLVAHSVAYPQDKLHQFYVFDVWDTETEQYTPWAFTYQMANTLGLNTVPIFYDGAFTSWEDLYKYVGRTEMGAEPIGEGIVIKSQDRLDNKFSGTPAYVKIVAKEFSEIHQSKPHEVDPAKLAEKQAQIAIVESIATQRRTEKIIQKFVEDGIVPENWDEKNLGAMAKILPKAVYEDCLKEERETVLSIENFGKLCAGIVMKHARALVK